jgi:hypothetical protein
MTYPLNGNTYEVVAVTTNTVTLAATANTTGWTYTSGGYLDWGTTAYGTHLVGTDLMLVSTSATFDAGMVGALFRLSEDGSAVGIQNAPVGDNTAALANGQTYTNEGNVYGVWNVTGLTTWDSVTRVPAHKSGTVRVFARASQTTFFDSDFLHPGYCIVKITGFTSSTQVSCELVRYQIPASIMRYGTVFWEEGAWSDYRGYPTAMAMFEQRLWFGGTDSDPIVIWSSKSGGAFENFEDGVGDSDAIIYRLAEGSGDRIRWLMGGRVLTAGTSQGEYAIAASSQQEALTPSNVRAVIQATYGTSDARPIRVNQSVMYPQRRGVATNAAKKLREFTYSLANDAYDSNNLTVFSEHITGPGFDQIAFAAEPDNVIWIRRTDGVAAGCTFEKTQEVLAWHRHVIGGTGALIKSMAVQPGADSDELWLSVERAVNGSTVRYIEVIVDGLADDTAKADAVYLDSAVVYSGAETTTVSGLNHLIGETVTILGNGAKLGTAVVSSAGKVTLPIACTKAVIGFPVATVIEPMDIEAGARAGAAQSRQKNVSEVFVRLSNSLGGTFGSTASDQRPILYRKPSMAMDASPPLYTGLVRLEMQSGWQHEGIVRIEHNDPFPFFVAGLVAEVNTTG